ncbi:MAG: tetratricopeptide repeat protein [Betaproteobacteria bacterium]
MKPLFVIFMTALLCLSCSKEPEKSAEPVSTEKSLFEEVKEQTIKNPKDVEAWYHLADLYERSEMYREEVDALQKVIAIDPGRGAVYSKLGTAYNRLGQYQEAVKNFEIAVKYSPKNALLFNNLAVSYGKIGKTREEIAALEKAISLRPRYSTARFNLGMALLKQGKPELALKQYNELKKFDEGAAASLKKEIEAKRK